ncbi:hypothetical protein [Pedobacter alpinus]|uniref:CAAX protease self-immunity n=1 Tax=Pedobacter alpinus TaxID=1590643 RepID=A0ABW5TNP4_9SPHI
MKSFNLKNEFLFFRLFLKNPNKGGIGTSKHNKFNHLIFALVINILIIISLEIVEIGFNLIDRNFHKNFSIQNNLDDDLNGISKPLLFLILCIIVPTVEEVAFRLPLNKNFKWSLIFTFLIIMLSLKFKPNDITTILMSLTLLIVIFVANQILKARFNLIINEIFYGKYFYIFFYCLTLIFSLCHINNYEWNNYTIINGLIFLSLSFIIDLLFGFLMLNCGFWYSLTLHITNNFIGYIIYFSIK